MESALNLKIFASSFRQLVLTTRTEREIMSSRVQIPESRKWLRKTQPMHRNDISRIVIVGTILVLLPALNARVRESSNDAGIEIELKHGTEDEQKTKAQLLRLLESYDLRKWMFTKKIMIDRDAIPHSHPVLTLHTRHLKSDDQLLSTFVHEQAHHWLEARLERTHAAEVELRKLYPKVPVGYPEGANDEDATYEHLIVCYLEMQADRVLLGNDRAAELMKFWAGDHYRWVYRTVVQDEQKIRQIVENNGLQVK
jgi:hypothetical protein